MSGLPRALILYRGAPCAPWDFYPSTSILSLAQLQVTITCEHTTRDNQSYTFIIYIDLFQAAACASRVNAIAFQPLPRQLGLSSTRAFDLRFTAGCI